MWRTDSTATAKRWPNPTGDSPRASLPRSDRWRVDRPLRGAPGETGVPLRRPRPLPDAGRRRVCSAAPADPAVADVVWAGAGRLVPVAKLRQVVAELRQVVAEHGGDLK